MIKNLIILFGITLLFAGCSCEVSSKASGSVNNTEKWIDKPVKTEIVRWTSTHENNPQHFQTMRFHTVCVDGVNYLFEAASDVITVKYNTDGTISTCTIPPDPYKER